MDRNIVVATTWMARFCHTKPPHSLSSCYSGVNYLSSLTFTLPLLFLVRLSLPNSMINILSCNASLSEYYKLLFLKCPSWPGSSKEEDACSWRHVQLAHYNTPSRLYFPSTSCFICPILSKWLMKTVQRKLQEPKQWSAVSLDLL